MIAHSAACSITLFALLCVSGCASVSPAPDDLATRHVAAPSSFAESQRGEGVTSEEVDSGWLPSFQDPVLEGLIREAWANNPDLYAAAARFDEAKASLRVASSYLAPQVDANAGASYTNHNGSSDNSDFSIGAGVSWEIDLWGRLRSDKAAARSVADSAGLDYLQARHSLASAVAQSYYAIVTAKQQLKIDEDLLAAERFTEKRTSERVNAGLGTSLDEDLAISNVRLAQASVNQDLAALRAAQRSLELLLGRYPSAELDTAMQTLPELSAEPVAVGVPTDLLERRPDVRSAEQQVNAAYYSVQSANAAKLPSLMLSADATQYFDPSEFISSVVASILAPIYEGGRLDAQAQEADAQQRQALGQFASIALNAFNEVETALSNERSLRQRELDVSEASRRLSKASEVAISRYDQGLMSILDLQQVRSADFSTRSLLLGVRYERIRQRLNLYLALGGPVSDEDDASSQETKVIEHQDKSTSTPNELLVGDAHNDQTDRTTENDHDR